MKTKSPPDEKEINVTSYRGTRCGVCYWALYDGDWCQNADCVMSGKSVGDNRIYLSNTEAQILINAKRKP